MKNKLFNWVVQIIIITFFPLKIQSQTIVDSILDTYNQVHLEYNEKTSILYNKILDISQNHEDRDLRIQASNSFGQFYIKENIIRLLDSIDYQVISLEEDDFIYPYFLAIGKIAGNNDSNYWALIPYILSVLDKDRNFDQLYLYSRLFCLSFKMSETDTSICIRTMAKSIMGLSKRKQNLLKIVDILYSD